MAMAMDQRSSTFTEQATTKSVTPGGIDLHRYASRTFSTTLEHHPFYKKMEGALRHHDGEHHKQDLHWLVDNLWFSGACGALVVVNAIVLGFETDYPEYTMTWMVFENVFTALFLLEMIIKLACWRLVYFLDIANWLDAAIVAFSIVDCWFSALVNPESKGKLKNFQILRVLRMVRIVRVIRILRYFRRLVMVVRGVVKAMETTFWVACVLLVAVYCCAIFVTEFIGHGTETLYPAYSTDLDVIDEQEIMQNFNPFLCFGGMSKSMFTLFNIAILSEWLEVVRPIFIKQPEMMFFFIAFALFVTFGIMNVIVAMIVDNVLQEKTNLEEEERSKEQRQKHKKWRKLVKLIRDLEDDDHTISYDRLKECMEPEVVFTHELNDPRSFAEKLLDARNQRELDHPEEKWTEKKWQKRLDIRDAFGNPVDLFGNEDFFASIKKGLPIFRDAMANLKKSQFPLSVRIPSAESHSLLDLLARCNLPEGLSAEELIMMFDSTGDGMLQHHEFLTNFYRLIEHNDTQQIALLQGGINSVKFMLHKNGIRIQSICDELQQLREPREGDIFAELRELRKLSENSANNQRSDTCGITSVASLIQETHRITEHRLQSLEEKIFKALDALQMCWQNRLDVEKIATKPIMMEPAKQIHLNDVMEAVISREPKEVVNPVSDCNSSHKDLDVTCGTISSHGASCTESTGCNGNAFTPSLHDVFQKVGFKTPHSTIDTSNGREKECEAKGNYFVDGFPHDTARTLHCSRQQFYRSEAMKPNGTSLRADTLSQRAALSCDRDDHHALDDSSRSENCSGGDQSPCSKLLPPESQHFQYEVVVQHGCSLGCTITWGYPEIADVGVEAAKQDIRPGDVIVECEGASTCGKSREELLALFQGTRPLHLVLRR